MPLPEHMKAKGHEPIAGCEKGGCLGYLGKPQDAWTEEELIELGKAVVKYMKKKDTVWYSGFLATEGISRQIWEYLKKKYPDILGPYIQIAAALQQEKLLNLPFLKKADANHARLILRHSHKEEFEDTLNAHSKSEKAQDIGQATIHGLIEAARGINKETSGTDQSVRPNVETDQSLLDKGQTR